MHYFSAEPTVASAEHLIHFTVGGRDFNLWSDRGVFSKNALDIGTEVLLNTLLTGWATGASGLAGPPEPAAELLDLGCGNGTIGVVLASFFPSLRLSLLDVNRRALGLATKNLGLYSLEGATVAESDGLAAAGHKHFDYIVSNPPIRTGKETVYRLYREACDHLKPGGKFYLVVGKKQGAESTRRYLTDLFGNCDRLARDRGFWVLQCSK